MIDNSQLTRHCRVTKPRKKDVCDQLNDDIVECLKVYHIMIGLFCYNAVFCAGVSSICKAIAIPAGQFVSPNDAYLTSRLGISRQESQVY